MICPRAWGPHFGGDEQMIVSDERFYKQEETMIRTVAIVAFGLALASAAQAMPVFDDAPAGQRNYASAYGLWRGQGHG